MDYPPQGVQPNVRLFMGATQFSTSGIEPEQTPPTGIVWHRRAGDGPAVKRLKDAQGTGLVIRGVRRNWLGDRPHQGGKQDPADSGDWTGLDAIQLQIGTV